ncbi:exodeoxyribonuclease V subunit gamma [Pantoea sp. SoEX]|uniref:exodeoxyribonuclease V subunit gamma n=1 Tax=Pantoea sp. SoEX TaxID=2576763 RepID=UPI001358B214|nr:exodeoxyribonuclease V subunit gamma [Pantoea sp. SoEX]MXP51216.1 exodeoxyribonuclease V subunit gamma [Pantoea sp. SoEX]
MLYIYHSNQLDILKSLLHSTINTTINNHTFKSEYILVQNLDMIKWLKKGTALELNMSTDLKFSVFISFIWDIMDQISPHVITKNFSNKNNMVFMIICRMSKILKKNYFPFLCNYLDNCCNEDNLFHLSVITANIFEKYIIYRPDWINLWEKGKLVDYLGDEQLWQAAIWNDLISVYAIKSKKYKVQQNNFYDIFIQKLHKISKIKKFLPSRLFIFAISSFSPYHLQVLHAMSNYIDIHVFFINHCRNYWGDIQDHIFLSRKSKNDKIIMNDDQIETSNYWSDFFNNMYEQHINNPLIVSWGKIGCDNLFLINQLEPSNHIDNFIDIKEDNLLHCIQNDILNLKNSSVIGLTCKDLKCNDQKRPIDIDDRSISINICHDIQHEVQILHNYLLYLMNSNLDIKENDIIIMVANIDTYMPFIKSIFFNKCINNILSVKISDYNIINKNPITVVFFKLLSLFDNDYVIEDILTLLDVSTLAKNFSVDENQLILLQNLIDNINTYEKLNEFKTASLNKNIQDKAIIIVHIKQFLLNYLNNYLQYISLSKIPINNLLDILLKNLCNIIFKINKWTIIFKKNYLLQDWLFLYKQLINDFFHVDNTSKSIFFFMEHNWNQLIQNSNNFIFKEISIKLLKNMFFNQLKQNNNNNFSFCDGTEVNFCKLTYTRFLPFKVICLLGMNKDDYPRKSNFNELNLMHKKPRKGDCHIIDEDQYLFLDILMCSKMKLYISYIDRSKQESTKYYPSNLITELLEYIGQNFYLKGDENLEIDKSHENIKKHLLQYHDYNLLLPCNISNNIKIVNYIDEVFPAIKILERSQYRFINELKIPKMDFLNIKQLLYFWQHPIRAWFNNRLNVFFSLNQYLSKNESYYFNKLKLYQLKNELLNALIEKNDENIENIYNHHKKFDYFPPGIFSEIFWQDQKKEMQQIAIKVLDNLQEMTEWKINLKLYNITLTGSLKQVQNNGLLRWCPNKLTIKDGLIFLLEHLIYCATGGNGNSKIFGMSKSYWYFNNIKKNIAIDFLNNYIFGYISGMTKPLLLLNKSSSTWLKYCYDKKTKKLVTDNVSITKAHHKLLISLNGEYKISGDNDDPYVKRLYRNLSNVEIKKIKQCSEIWHLPVLQIHENIIW